MLGEVEFLDSGRSHRWPRDLFEVDRQAGKDLSRPYRCRVIQVRDDDI